jgi:hypothetical protein
MAERGMPPQREGKADDDPAASPGALSQDGPAVTASSGPDWPGAVGSALAVAVGIAALAFSGEFSMLGAVFPRTISVLLIVLGLLYIGLTVRGRTRAGSSAPGSTPRRIGVMVVMLAWAFALQPVGFLPSSAVAFVLLLALAQHERWTPRRLVGYATAGAVLLTGLYALFKLVLLVPLP